MHILRQDLLYAVRQLRKSPGFTLLVILTVALGIGANTAIFSMINGFLRPLPVKSPEQIVVLAARVKGDETGFRYRFSFPALEDLRNQADRFSDVFAFNTSLAGLAADGKTTPFLYSDVTGNCFPALGLKPAAGRLFLPGEGEVAGADQAIVLGYAYWQKRFGGNSAAIGRQVRVDGKTVRIVGVAPEGFHGLYAGAEMDGYMPLSVLASQPPRGATLFTDRKFRPLTVLARLKPGVSLAQAQSSVDVLARRFEAQYPEANKGIGIRVVPESLARPLPLNFLADAVPLIRRFLLLLAGLVLLLACMNVANLLMVRATIRQREMAIRAALGSGRARLMRQMLTESLLLALAGAAGGLVLGKWASQLFAGTIDLATDFPISLDFSFDWRVFAYALTAAVLTGVLIGIWPAIRVSQTNANAVLHDGGRGDFSGSGMPSRQRVRSLLVMTQVAGSLVLLIVAGLFVRSLQHAQSLDLGFDSSGVLNARLDPRYLGYDAARTKEFYRELERRVRALPGVQAVSVAFSVPMGYISDGTQVFVEGRPAAADQQPPVVGCNYIDGDYFETMRIPVLRGRKFKRADDEPTPSVAIVNQSMAARFWPNQDPIGKRFRMGGPDAPLWEVVGVARDSKYLAVFEGPLPYIYIPQAPGLYSLRHLQVRSAMPPAALKRQVLRAIQSLDPDMPVADLRTMRESIEGGPAGFLLFRIGAIQAGAMGLLGLVLAIIGVYGVVSYGASQRTHEIGIRMALGAVPSDILSLILRQGVRLVAAGVVAGLVAAAALTRLTSHVLLIGNATDPLTFTGVTLLLAAIALWACYVPARRAMRVDPMVALRHE
jgi:predicted permease